MNIQTEALCSLLTGTIAMVANASTLYDVITNGVKIIIDGKEKYISEDMTNSSRPIDIDISVKGGNDIQIVFEQSSSYLRLADAGFYQ